MKVSPALIPTMYAQLSHGLSKSHLMFVASTIFDLHVYRIIYGLAESTSFSQLFSCINGLNASPDAELPGILNAPVLSPSSNVYLK